MATPKRGPGNVDLTTIGGEKVKLDFSYNPIMNQFIVRKGRRKFYWTATEFADHFRGWLVRQKDNS